MRFTHEHKEGFIKLSFIKFIGQTLCTKLQDSYQRAYLNHISHVLYVLCQLMQLFIFTLELCYPFIFGLDVFVQLVKKKTQVLQTKLKCCVYTE